MKRREIKQGRRIVVLCEGESEEIAVKHFIARQWEIDGLKSVGLHTINLRAKLEDVFEYVPRYRRDPLVAAVFTLIDLYGMNRVRHSTEDELAQKVIRVKDWLRSNFEAGFFHPHVSVHEIEAWILAEGACLASRLKEPRIEPNRNAEAANFDNPPSKHLDNLCKRHRSGDGYHKINDGTPLFKCLKFSVVYDSCRYFREFYDELKSVGQFVMTQ